MILSLVGLVLQVEEEDKMAYNPQHRGFGLQGVQNQIMPVSGANLVQQGGPRNVFGASNQASNFRAGQPINAAPGQTPPIIQQQMGQQPQADVPGQQPIQTFGGFKPARQTPPIIQQQVGQPQAPQAPAQQFGLAGGEQAFGSGLRGGISALQTGTQSALNTLGQGGELTGQQFDIGLGGLANQNQIAQQQIIDAQNQAQQQSVNAQQQSLSQIQSGTNSGVSALAPLVQAGNQSTNLQAALSGSLGPEAQAAAFANFQDSPTQKFLRDQGELSVINQAAATGGTGGANVLKELQRFGTGLAAQDFQNQFNRLGDVANRGAQAAGQTANLFDQGGQAGANIISSLGGQRANQAGQLGQFGADLSSGTGRAQLAARTQFGNVISDLSSRGAGIQQQAGQQAANLFGDAGARVGGARIGAGQDIARSIQGVTGQLSNTQQSGGAGLSDIIGGGAASISNLLANFGELDAATQQQLAVLLQNLETEQATQLANIQGQIGQSRAKGILGQASGLRAGLNRTGKLLGFE